MTKNNTLVSEKSEQIVLRFEKGIKEGFGAVLIMHSIHKRGMASSKEIQDDLKNLFSEAIQYKYTSFYRLFGRMRDELGLVSETARKKSNGPSRVYYELTPLGEEVLEKAFTRYIQPLGQLRLS